MTAAARTPRRPMTTLLLAATFFAVFVRARSAAVPEPAAWPFLDTVPDEGPPVCPQCELTPALAMLTFDLDPASPGLHG